MASQLPETTLTVLPEWLDYNGHMNVAYYVLAFDRATDHVYDQWGIGEAYLKTGFSVYTLGMNVDYLAELRGGAPIRITTQLHEIDHKRILYFHSMYHAETGVLAATNECLGMNVSLETGKSADFSAEIQTKLQVIHTIHRTHGYPKGAGRILGIRR